MASGGLHCREEERSMGGGIRHLWNPPSSAGLKPHGPWRTGEIRGPGPTWNVSFVFIYDFWKCKSHKNWKRNIFFKLNWQQTNFWYRNKWEWNPKLQILRTKHLKKSFPGSCSCEEINNVCKVNFVDNVLLSVQKDQVVHSLLCHGRPGRAQDKFDFLHMVEDSFSCDSGIL